MKIKNIDLNIWLKYLIIKNAGKVFLLSLVLITAFIHQKLDKTPVSKKYSNVIWIDTIQHKCIYTSESIHYFKEFGADISYQSYKWDGSQLEVNYFVSESVIIIRILLVISASILFLILLFDLTSNFVSFFDHREIYRLILEKNVRLSEEGGVYYYHIFGKLIYQSNYPLNINDYNIRDNINFYMRNPHIFPQWVGTKQEIRDEKLEKILN